MSRFLINRRQVVQAAALAAAGTVAGEAADPALGINVLRDAAKLNGARLTDDRLRVLQPVIEQRQGRLQRLRDFDVGDKVGPTQGILG